MGIQVSYEMKDLLANKELDISFESECYTTRDGEQRRTWDAFTADGTYMGSSYDDNIYGAYWFDNKNINYEAVDVLVANNVEYSRG